MCNKTARIIAEEFLGALRVCLKLRGSFHPFSHHTRGHHPDPSGWSGIQNKVSPVEGLMPLLPLVLEVSL